MTDPSVSEKRCSKCKILKPSSEYHKNRSKKDGMGDQCKPCFRATHKRYSQTDKAKERNRKQALRWFQTEKGMAYKKSQRDSGKSKAYSKKYGQSPKGKETKRAYYALYKMQNRNKLRARAAVRYAIILGELSPAHANLCARCGAQAQGYHHHSYAPEYKLDVVPLCKKCHVEAH